MVWEASFGAVILGFLKMSIGKGAAFRERARVEIAIVLSLCMNKLAIELAGMRDVFISQCLTRNTTSRLL